MLRIFTVIRVIMVIMVIKGCLTSARSKV
jgi:hypothetical protein